MSKIRVRKVKQDLAALDPTHLKIKLLKNSLERGGISSGVAREVEQPAASRAKYAVFVLSFRHCAAALRLVETRNHVVLCPIRLDDFARNRCALLRREVFP